FSKNHVKGRISQIMSGKIYKKSTLVIGIVIALLLAIGLLTTNKQSASKDFMDYVPHPKSTVLLHQQKIKNGTLYVYKDETGLRQMFISNDLKVNNNSANVELKPKEGISWGMLDNQKVSIVSLAGMVTNEDIQSVVVKQGAEEKQATIVETQEGRMWSTYFEDTLEPFKTEARSSDGRLIWENPVDKLSEKVVRVLSLTKEERDIYDIFSKDLNEKHLAKLEPISIAKLYVQSQLDKRYDVVYALYTDREEYVQWSKEEDEKMPAQDRGTQEQILQKFANIEKGKFIQTDDISGYIEYFRPSMGDSLEQVMAGFNMIKDEDGIWNVAFMPIQ
ncbi:MAG: hypothetical protein ACI35O_17305, partial [Bacillaceae bacterium]